METQNELGLFETPTDDPKIDQLINFLRGRGWMSARQISDALGSEFNERKVRSIASADARILSFPGSPGYRLTREATADERDRAISSFRSQANNMNRRALEVSKIHRGTASSA